MIDPVEGFGAECDAVPLLDSEVFVQAQIVILEASTVNQVAHAISHDRAVGRLGEDWRAVRASDAEPEIRLVSPHNGVFLIATAQGRIAVDAPELTNDAAAEAADAGEIIVRADSERGAGLHLRHSGDCPAAEQLAHQPGAILED